MGKYEFTFCVIVICALYCLVNTSADHSNSSTCLNGCVGPGNQYDNLCNVSHYDCMAEMGGLDKRASEIDIVSIELHSSPSDNYFTLQWKPAPGITNTEAYNILILDHQGETLDDCQQILVMPRLLNQLTFQLCSPVSFSKAAVEITTLPNNQTTHCLLQFPSPPSAAEPYKWSPVLAVITALNSRSVNLILSPAPSDLNVTHILVSVISDKIVVHQKNMSGTETRYEFHVDNYKLVEIQVSVYAEACPRMCGQNIITDIKFPEVEEPTTPTLASTSTPATRKTTVPSSFTVSTHPPTDMSVIVRPAAEQKEFQRNIKIIVGTVLGFGAIAALVVILCFCIYRRRNNNQSANFALQRFGRRRGSDTSSLSDALDKQLPIILLLYSYDCPAHERVVIQFANYLQFVANCDVLFDVWDQHQVLSQGIHNWFHDKLEVAQYVIIICSTGARFKCARNRQQQMKQDRPFPDLFAWAVDQIGEGMRKGKMDGEAYLRYLVVNFEYSSHSDIPPKLDTALKFSLMKDIFILYCHLQCLKSDCLPEGLNVDGITEDTWYKTDCGQGLLEAIKNAKQFFQENPDWLAQTLEPCPSVLPSGAIEESSTDSRCSQIKKKFRRARSRSLSSESDRDMLYERQKKKRQKKADKKLLQAKSSENSIEKPPSPTAIDSPVVSSQDQSSSSSASSSSPLMLNSTHDKIIGPKQLQPLPAVPGHGLVQRSVSQPEPGYNNQVPPRKQTSLGSLHNLSSFEMDFDEEDNDVDEIQLKKDIDFIQNFDVHQSSGSLDPLRDPLQAVEHRGYSPTEGFSNQGPHTLPDYLSSPPRKHSSHLVIDFDLHHQPTDSYNTNINNSNLQDPTEPNNSILGLQAGNVIFTVEPGTNDISHTAINNDKDSEKKLCDSPDCSVQIKPMRDLCNTTLSPHNDNSTDDQKPSVVLQVSAEEYNV